MNSPTLSMDPTAVASIPEREIPDINGNLDKARRAIAESDDTEVHPFAGDLYVLTGQRFVEVTQNLVNLLTETTLRLDTTVAAVNATIVAFNAQDQANGQGLHGSVDAYPSTGQ